MLLQQSTWHDVEAYLTRCTGVIVPMGKGVNSAQRSSLLYNEYIVYDVAQINIKYMLQVDFKYKW